MLEVILIVELLPFVDVESVFGGGFDYLLPLVPDLFIRYLREAALDGLDQVVFLVTDSHFECLLDNEIAIAMTHKGAESVRETDLAYKYRPRVRVSKLETLFNNA